MVLDWHTFPFKYQPFSVSQPVQVAGFDLHRRQCESAHATTSPVAISGPKLSGITGLIVACWHTFRFKYQPFPVSQPLHVVYVEQQLLQCESAHDTCDAPLEPWPIEHAEMQVFDDSVKPLLHRSHVR
jgi:hypothetical protein